MELRLIDYNFSQLAATTITASSSDPSFPVSNVKNPIRGRVHRTAGNFVIDATNNKLNFKESGGGAELTATIDSGTYSPATLAAAIKTALEAAGAATYTVTYSSATGKWTIATDGVFLSLLWSTGTDTATAVHTTIGFPSSADSTGATTYTGSMIAIHTEEWIKLDLGTTEPIDLFALLFDLVAGKKLSSSAVVTLQANASDSWAAPAVSQVVTPDSTYNVATHFFTSNQSYRYWRVKIVDPRNAYLYVETGKIVLGKGVQLSLLPGRGFEDQLQDLSDIQQTKFGHRYADLYPIRRSLKFEYRGMAATDAALLQLAYRRVGRALPVAVAIDPTATAYDKDRFFLYGYFADSLALTHLVGTKFAGGIAIEEAV